jgi:hypothetical protein
MGTPAQARARRAGRLEKRKQIVDEREQIVAKREQIVDGFLNPQNRKTLLADLDAGMQARAVREILPFLSLDRREFEAQLRARDEQEKREIVKRVKRP